MKQDKNEKQKTKGRAALISLAVSLVLLGGVIAVSMWYQRVRFVQFEPVGMIIGDVIGFLLIFAIIYHFLSPSDEN